MSTENLLMILAFLVTSPLWFPMVLTMVIVAFGAIFAVISFIIAVLMLIYEEISERL